MFHMGDNIRLPGDVQHFEVADGQVLMIVWGVRPLTCFLQELGLPVTMEPMPKEKIVASRVAADEEPRVKKQLLEAKVEAMGSA